MANIFKRINDIFTANISDLIDRVEDPEKMIKQIIREMEENIGRAKDGVVEAVAAEKLLRRDVEQHQKECAEWHDKARGALKSGNEDLARQALVRKNEHEKILASLTPALESAVNTSASLKAQLKALEAKLDEAKRKRSSLVARQRAAEARESMSKVGANLKDGLASHAQFGRMEDKVAEMEARSEAVGEVYESDSVERQFEDMQSRQEVDDDLAALKRELETGAR